MGHFCILNQNTTVFLLADLIWDSDLFRPSDQSGHKKKASPMLCTVLQKSYGDSFNLHLSRLQAVCFIIRKDKEEDAGLM